MLSRRQIEMQAILALAQKIYSASGQCLPWGLCFDPWGGSRCTCGLCVHQTYRGNWPRRTHGFLLSAPSIIGILNSFCKVTHKLSYRSLYSRHGSRYIWQRGRRPNARRRGSICQQRKIAERRHFCIFGVGCVIFVQKSPVAHT